VAVPELVQEGFGLLHRERVEVLLALPPPAELWPKSRN
jgi:hypothetical protein